MRDVKYYDKAFLKLVSIHTSTISLESLISFVSLSPTGSGPMQDTWVSSVSCIDICKHFVYTSQV